MPPAQPDLLFIAPLPLASSILLFQLNEVLLQSLDVQLLLHRVLFDHVLHLFHFLIEHGKQLRVFFVFDFHLMQVSLGFGGVPARTHMAEMAYAGTSRRFHVRRRRHSILHVARVLK